MEEFGRQILSVSFKKLSMVTNVTTIIYPLEILIKSSNGRVVIRI